MSSAESTKLITLKIKYRRQIFINAQKEVYVVQQILDDWKKTGRKHPNIVEYQQIIPNGDSYEIIMEACHGSLLDLLKQYEKRFNAFQVPDLLDFLQQIMCGYQYLQRLFPQIFIHRDFTLDNFLYIKQDDRYIIKISDFGVSKIYRKEKEQLMSIKEKDTLLSSNFQNLKQLYMPKEIKERSKVISNKVDVYSLGTCLYFLSRGKVDEYYDGLRHGLHNSIYSESQIKIKFYNLISQMCSEEEKDRPSWEELYAYMFELPSLYNSLNKKQDTDQKAFLEYLQEAISQLTDQNLLLNQSQYQNQTKSTWIQNDVTSNSNNQLTMIKIDSKVYQLVFKFKSLLFSEQQTKTKKQFVVSLLVFQHKIKIGYQKLLEEFNKKYKYLYRIQSLKYVLNIIMTTLHKMMSDRQQNNLKDSYMDLMFDYEEQLNTIKTIKFNDGLKKYFYNYRRHIEKSLK